MAPGGTLRFAGRHLSSRMLVTFAARRTAQTPRGTSPTVRARLRRRNGFQATVPPFAVTGRISVRARNGPHSNRVPIRIRPIVKGVHGRAAAFAGTGMWIWQLDHSSGGDLAAIAAQAHQYGVRTVLVKSSDGRQWFGQFTPALVQTLKSAGLHVCAWQFVYGSFPSAEAALGVRAAQTGAECLVIDAESRYEGRYAPAQLYIAALRGRVGPRYPVGLTSFPFNDLHPGLPYSVFLGPGGAQHNLPQMYWRAIGTTVDDVYAHTLGWNRLYGRQIFPLGQLYDDPPPAEIARFRQLAQAYGVTGVSWWSWQSASQQGWAAIAAPLGPLASPPPAIGFPTLQTGARGDAVVWAQQHLVSAGEQVPTDGIFDPRTAQGAQAFQAANGLPVTGTIDPATWTALLRHRPALVDWSQAVSAARAARSGVGGPRSAGLPAERDELRARAG